MSAYQSFALTSWLLNQLFESKTNATIRLLKTTNNKHSQLVENESKTMWLVENMYDATIRLVQIMNSFDLDDLMKQEI